MRCAQASGRTSMWKSTRARPLPHHHGEQEAPTRTAHSYEKHKIFLSRRLRQIHGRPQDAFGDDRLRSSGDYMQEAPLHPSPPRLEIGCGSTGFNDVDLTTWGARTTDFRSFLHVRSTRPVVRAHERVSCRHRRDLLRIGYVLALTSSFFHMRFLTMAGLACTLGSASASFPPCALRRAGRTHVLCNSPSVGRKNGLQLSSRASIAQFSPLWSSSGMFASSLVVLHILRVELLALLCSFGVRPTCLMSMLNGRPRQPSATRASWPVRAAVADWCHGRMAGAVL